MAFVISTLPTATVGISQANPVGPITITGSTSTVTLTLSDTTGVLSATAGSGGDTVVPTDSGKTLTITGTQAQVDNDLGTLTDTEPVTSDTIAINASDSSGGKAMPVTIAVTANSVPTISAPASAMVQAGQATAISDVSIVEDGNTTTGFTNQPGGEMFTAILTDTKGVLSANFGTDGGGVITPSTEGTMLKISGSLHDVNADLKTLTDTSTTSDTITVLASDQFGNNAAAKQIAVTSGEPPPYVLPLGPPNNFLVNGWQSQGEPYNGPVAGLTDEIIMVTPDNLNILAEKSNVFIRAGTGSDAIDATSVGGHNILDASTNTNFLVGSQGTDEFYVDTRGVDTRGIFDTIRGFHTGDAATFWGITSDQMPKLGNDVLPSAPGLDFAWTINGQDINTNIPGYSTADVASGKLSFAFGRSPDLPGLPGSDYMQVHAS